MLHVLTEGSHALQRCLSHELKYRPFQVAASSISYCCRTIRPSRDSELAGNRLGSEVKNSTSEEKYSTREEQQKYNTCLAYQLPSKLILIRKMDRHLSVVCSNSRLRYGAGTVECLLSNLDVSLSPDGAFIYQIPHWRDIPVIQFKSLYY